MATERMVRSDWERKARAIVALMISRKRLARHLLRRAPVGDTPTLVEYRACLEAQFAESHNAAELCRRLLYRGEDAL